MSRLTITAVALLSSGALTAAFAQAQVVQEGAVRVSASAKIQPKLLPRQGTMPISAHFAGRITSTNATSPPRLESLQIAINRNGRVDTTGLPLCDSDQIGTASTTRALAACRGALVGGGKFFVDVDLPGQEPYPAIGRLLVFNGVFQGRPALLGHIYSARPFATSFVVPFVIRRIRRGNFGTELTAHFPESFGRWGNVTGLEMKLSRRYSYGGSRRSVVSASCPAPKELGSAVFTLARTSFGFTGGPSISVDQIGTCKARGK
jgi:hypothetical protein